MENKTYCVYQIHNKVEDQSYIGSTSDLNARIKQHKKGKYEWQIDFAAHTNNYEVIILEDNISFEDISKKELQYIKKYNSVDNGYNGTYVTTRRIITDEEKKKMSETRKGHIVTEETRKKISEGRKGIKHTEEARKKMSEAKKGRTTWNKGKKFSEESRKKMSEAHKNISEETRRKMSEALKKYWADKRNEHKSI